MEYIILVLTLLGILAIILVFGYFDRIKARKKMTQKFKDEFGNLPLNEYSENEMNNIRHMFYRYADDHSIDDITAGDLEIDDIFRRINYSRSSLGSSYLYYALRNPVEDKSKLKEFDEKVDYMSNHEDERLSLRCLFNEIGKLRVSLFDCIDLLKEVPRINLLKDFLGIIFIFVGIVACFFSATLGIVILLATVIYNIISYYSKRGAIEPYIITFGYINNYILIAKDIARFNGPGFNDDISEINEYIKLMKPFTKHASFVVNTNRNTGAGNPLDIFADYIKMIFHMDIIYFYKMLKFLVDNVETCEKLYFALGRLETYISIAYFRASLNDWCKPKEGDGILIINGYHPLIKNPVVNSIDADKGVLLTGSNASGKSTFLKTVALNALLSETIATVCATNYSGKHYSIFSSMSLRDNLSGQDSYFMVEIKAMKRILDYRQIYNDKDVLCFVDEVLRGTNTVERISASTQILKYLSENNCLCFAATHDGELTYLLEDDYTNYHFEEEIKDGDVSFNYLLNKGRASTRNAIKLLEVMGFPSNIIESAEYRAQEFIEKGVWS